MCRTDRLFFTIIQFVLLIDGTKQSQFKQAILLLKTIGNTIKNPVLKTIGNNIKKSMGMFRRNKNHIKNTSGLQEKYLRSSHNVGKKSVRYLVKEETTKSIPPLKQLSESELKRMVKGSRRKLKDKEFKTLIDETASKMSKGELRSMLQKTTKYMDGKELRNIVDKIAVSNKMLPYLFVTGFLNNVINYNEDSFIYHDTSKSRDLKETTEQSPETLEMDKQKNTDADTGNVNPSMTIEKISTNYMINNIAKKCKNIKIIQASKSKPRKALFKQNGFQNIETLDSGFAEDLDKKIYKFPSEYVRATSKGKIDCAVAKIYRKYSNCILISCDTVVVKGNKVFEKPKDIEDQKNMLRTFSGSYVDVLSWVNMCFIKNNKRRFYQFKSTSRANFKELPEEIIEMYVVKNPGVMDAAGGFRVQVEPNLVDNIEGSYSNIIGFPLEDFAKRFERAFSDNFE